MDETSAQAQQQSAWQVLAPLIDLVTPLSIRAVAALRLADFMIDGAKSSDELAQCSGTNPDAVDKVLRHLVGHGVFIQQDSGLFALNDKAELLRSDHPSGMRVSLDLEGFGGQMDVAFTGLLHTLRTGNPAWETVFGAPFWEFLSANPAMSASFDQAMAAGAEYVADDAAAYDWPETGLVVDVGGGTGALLATVLEARPGLRGMLVDLPDTVSRGRDHLVNRGLETRSEVAGQSFFDPLPDSGDVYVLNSVLHDWNDADATAVLRRCADASGQKGRVVVIEQNNPEGDRTEFAEMDLRMLVLCGGTERTLDQYLALGETAGLHASGTSTTGMGQLCIEFFKSPLA
ncbi:methyltransferase [Paeniglutamicibacter gangotriensis]|uniref:Methyltransferase n=1 Tax=Paeniglutamicibacter gangotriensis TaxID=254787 RepID=A0A5B0EJY9_9MICC|nr:methyltransferase [Paeniglutamicibacter gangotriensis]KAA0977649.1 methyltransferase [Paeniglutamicibacter gangotriensis]